VNIAKPQNVFLALADPTRRWVIEHLSQVESDTASNLAEQLPISRQAVSKHFNILIAAGLVDSHQVGRERHYSLNPEPLIAANDWIEEISKQWDRRLQRLQTYLSEEKGELSV
jgi:DNA-binding transcriptional ArsR family regulator